MLHLISGAVVPPEKIKALAQTITEGVGVREQSRIKHVPAYAAPVKPRQIGPEHEAGLKKQKPEPHNRAQALKRTAKLNFLLNLHYNRQYHRAASSFFI